MDEGLQRLRRLEERRKLAEALGVTIPAMPAREPGETDKQYGCRIAAIAKGHCGPAPRPKVPPRKVPRLKPVKPDIPPDSPDDVSRETALANMTPDPTTEEDP
jgi:hypothetical protein